MRWRWRREVGAASRPTSYRPRRTGSAMSAGDAGTRSAEYRAVPVIGRLGIGFVGRRDPQRRDDRVEYDHHVVDVIEGRRTEHERPGRRAWRCHNVLDRELQQVTDRGRRVAESG